MADAMLYTNAGWSRKLDPGNEWGKPPSGFWDGWMTEHGNSFNSGVKYLLAELDKAQAELSKDPGNPELLAKYQNMLNEYTMFRMLQSNSSKSLGDMQKSTIRNIG